MKLFLDAGNTRIKWLDSKDNLIRVANDLEALAAQWSALEREPGAACFIGGCCVRGAEFEASIAGLARRLFDVRIEWVVSVATACGVCNAYSEPEKLGADRWAAVVAAHVRWPDQACVVVDAGTAITVDMLAADGRYRGGVILPGYQLMLDALARPNQLFSGLGPEWSHAAKTNNALNTSTQEAIRAGAVFAVQGGIKAVIERQAAQLNVKIEVLSILLTGGDAAMFDFIFSQTHRAPELVLDGVRLLTEKFA